LVINELELPAAKQRLSSGNKLRMEYIVVILINLYSLVSKKFVNLY